MQLLSRMFCGCPRSLRFYTYYDKCQEHSDIMGQYDLGVAKDYAGVDFVQRRQNPELDMDPDTVREQVNNKSGQLVYGQALNLLDYFNEVGGFEAFIKLMEEGNERLPEPEKKEEG